MIPTSPQRAPWWLEQKLQRIPLQPGECTSGSSPQKELISVPQLSLAFSVQALVDLANLQLTSDHLAQQLEVQKTSDYRPFGPSSVPKPSSAFGGIGDS